MYLTLEQIKAHCNISQDFKDDDNLLLLYLQAAEDAIEKRIDQRLQDIVDPNTGYLPKSVIQTILLLVGQFYKDREATTNLTSNEIPIGLNWLADLNKHYYIP